MASKSNIVVCRLCRSVVESTCIRQCTSFVPLESRGEVDTGFLAWGGGQYKCQTCIIYVIVLAILHILIGIGLTNKLQNRRIEL